jgi:signal transduction histidine kinase
MRWSVKKCFEQHDFEPTHFADKGNQITALILAAQDDERARIARDLHDDVCQQISVIAWDLRTLAAQSQPAGRKSIDSVLGKLDHIAAGLRAISHRLHPSIVTDLGLLAAVECECGKFSEMTGLAVDLSTQGALDVRGPGALALYRILQESLHNVRKHARASRVTVAVKRTSGELSLRVQDCGVGFDATRPRGLGLTSMRERMALAHGKLTIHSVPGQGTVIEARIKKRRESLPSASPEHLPNELQVVGGLDHPNPSSMLSRKARGS